MRVAQMELNTNPEAWRVDRTGRGRVVIWMVLPMRLAMRYMPNPNCHLRLLCAGRGVRGSEVRRHDSEQRESSRICDLRCNVRPIDCTAVLRRPTRTPIYN